ncbi:hypothetical protein ACLOJK_038496 [Asimina triloba]
MQLASGVRSCSPLPVANLLSLLDGSPFTVAAARLLIAGSDGVEASLLDLVVGRIHTGCDRGNRIQGGATITEEEDAASAAMESPSLAGVSLSLESTSLEETDFAAAGGTVAGDKLDGFRSHWIWNRGLTAVLLDGSDHLIGASPTVVLVGGGVGKMEIWILIFEMEGSESTHRPRYFAWDGLTIRMLVEKPIAGNRGCRLEDDDGAPKLVLRWCTKFYVHAMEFGALQCTKYVVPAL